MHMRIDQAWYNIFSGKGDEDAGVGHRGSTIAEYFAYSVATDDNRLMWQACAVIGIDDGYTGQCEDGGCGLCLHQAGRKGKKQQKISHAGKNNVFLFIFW